MDHNDVRKGILQANMIERNSGLLSAEMTIVPFVAAIFAANAAENSLLSFFLFFVVGISSFVFFLWCSEYRAPRFLDGGIFQRNLGVCNLEICWFLYAQSAPSVCPIYPYCSPLHFSSCSCNHCISCYHAQPSC